MSIVLQAGGRRESALGARAASAKTSMAVQPFTAELETTAKTHPVIAVQEVHKYYELGETRVHALRGVTLEIGRGEFVAIMGASGSGKSTFMNILGCLDRPSNGRYLLDGVDVTQYSKVELAAI